MKYNISIVLVWISWLFFLSPAIAETRTGQPSAKPNILFLFADDYCYEAIGELGITDIETPNKSDQPFFMYLAFNAPHDPRQAPKEFIDKYPLDRVKIPSNFLPEYPYKDDIGCPHSLRDENLAPMPRSEHSVRVHRQEYYALITHLDQQIGRILDGLERSGKAESTWIFFTADHGLAVGHHGLFGKQNMYEHSVRVPFIVVGPEVPENKRLDNAIYLQEVP